MDRMIAMCGLICSDCPGYVATQANDRAMLEQLAEQARNEYNVPDATADTVLCDGCLSASPRKCSYCAECGIRLCGVSRRVENCAICEAYPCEQITSFFRVVPAARIVLEEVRRRESLYTR